jgi:CRISPR-associated endonuclease Cas2
MALQTAVLRTLYGGSIITVALFAPKMTRLFPAADRSAARRKALYARIAQAKYRLRVSGFIKEVDGRVELTREGRAHIERILMYDYRIPEPVLWDGKWRILMFDIHERRRHVRTQLRDLLKGAGFVRLQDSVWVHPYRCDEFVTLVRAHLASGVGELRSIVANALESDRALREHFHLTLL